MATLQFSNDQEWTPKYIEVMATPYEHAPGESILWPKRFPGLDSVRVRTRGESFSIFLDYSEKGALASFLKTQKPLGAVEISGKKFSVATRYVFPSEPVWRKAFFGE